MGIFDFFKKQKETDEQREAREFLSMLDTSKVRYSGGDGTSADKAVVVEGVSMLSGPMAEYEYLGRKFGKMNVDWTLDSQGVQKGPSGQPIDAMSIKLKNGQQVTIYFDISSFMGNP